MSKQLLRAMIIALWAQGAAAQELTGLADCDTFITRYEACVTTRVPAGSQAALKAQIDLWRSEWVKMAKDPATRPVLEGVCKSTMQQIRASVKTLGCEF